MGIIRKTLFLVIHVFAHIQSGTFSVIPIRNRNSHTFKRLSRDNILARILNDNAFLCNTIT